MPPLTSNIQFKSTEEMEREFCLQLQQSLISPTLNYKQQDDLLQWITSSLESANLKFKVQYGTDLTEDHFPSDVSPTKQQFQQCSEVVYFLQNNSRFLSLYCAFVFSRSSAIHFIFICSRSSFTDAAVFAISSSFARRASACCRLCISDYTCCFSIAS